MSVPELKSVLTRKLIEDEIAIFDKSGKNDYLREVKDKTSFEDAKVWYIFRDGKYYPMKAIAMMAYFRAKGSRPKYHVPDDIARVLRDVGIAAERQSKFKDEGYDSPDSGVPETFAWVATRPKQKAFRDMVLSENNGRCQISGCGIRAVLEAAHIVAVSNGGSYNVENGLLLRADFHRLLDRRMMDINPKTGSVTFSNDAIQEAYYLTLGEAPSVKLSLVQAGQLKVRMAMQAKGKRL